MNCMSSNPVLDVKVELDKIPALPIRDGIEYRHIPNFLGYCAGDDGSLWSCRVPNKRHRMYLDHWFEKSVWKTVDGYFVCSLRGDDGKEHRKLAHTIILETFVGQRPTGFDCLHGNGVPNDNRLENLKWGTRKENMEDARRHGTLARREKHGHAKLNSERVAALLALHEQGWTQRRLAGLFDISQATISSVITNKRWE